MFRRAAYFEAYNETVFRDISFDVEEQTDSWSLGVLVEFANNTRGLVSGTLEMSILGVKSTDTVNVRANSDDEFVFQKTITIPKVR